MSGVIQFSPDVARNSMGIVATIGYFDGVHLGHRFLIESAVCRARHLGTRCIAISFYPHPRQIVDPEGAPQLITTVVEKQRLVLGLGVDEMVTITFSRQLAGMEPHAFLSDLHNQLNLRELWFGHDFGLGRGRSAGPEEIATIGAQLGFRAQEVETLYVDGRPISSTRIRRGLAEGNLQVVERMLGRPYSLTGVVQRGYGRGRKLATPTANLVLPPEKVMPRTGVYVMDVSLRGVRHPAAGSLGVHPTFGLAEPNLEVHLLDFSDDIYGLEVEARFLEFLRDERAFASEVELRQQIGADIDAARRYFQQRARK